MDTSGHVGGEQDLRRQRDEAHALNVRLVAELEELRALVRRLRHAGGPKERARAAGQLYASLPEARAGGGAVVGGLGALV